MSQLEIFNEEGCMPVCRCGGIPNSKCSFRSNCLTEALKSDDGRNGYGILPLTLKKEAFEVMVTGEKKMEFREPSEWIYSRICNTRYTHIKFVNGYGDHRPFFIVELNGWGVTGESDTEWFQYSNGLKVSVEPWDVVIHLGNIIKTGNL